MQINPKILSLAGVHIAFQDDAKIRWIDFVRVIAVFLFRKPLMDVRYQTLFNLLGLKKDYKVLEYDDYMQDQLQKFVFKKRKACIVPTPEIQAFWNKVRRVLLKNKEEVFQIGDADTFSSQVGCRVLSEAEVVESDMMMFFDFIYDID